MGRLILLLFWGLVICLVLQAFRRRRNGARRDSAATTGLTMVRCAHCQVHLPERDALSAAGKHFCCIEHQRADGAGG